MGVFYEAPSWKHEDYWPFLLLQRIMEYDPNAPINTNYPYGLYNYMNRWFGDMKDIKKQECLFIPYRDTGMFGHYASGEFITSLIKPTIDRKQTYLEELSFEEIQRAKNKIYTELLAIEAGSDMIQTLGCQLIYMDKKVPKTEIASRIAAMDKKYLEATYKKWFSEGDTALAIYGPTSTIQRINEV
ncbi:unnamed protein product [Blepharisma stoltei]|nr:unnamed protein product [Blepharisma stoltei]